MTTRQRHIVWAWIGLIVASCICPPWHQGNSSRGYGLIFAPPYATVDLSRLVLEWVAISALLAGLYFFWPAAPHPQRFNFLRVHLSRRATAGLIAMVAAVACVCAAWGLSRISRSLPAEELVRLDGLCSSSSGTFSGEIHNGSEAWTIREVTIRLTLKEKVLLDWDELSKSLEKYGATLPDSPPPDGGHAQGHAPAPQMKSRDYQIRDLWIRPLETSNVSVRVLTPPGSEFVQWKPIAAKGFKDFWHGIETISAVPPAKKMLTFDPSEVDEAAPAKQKVTSEEPILDKLLRQAPPVEKLKVAERAQHVQPIPPPPKGYTFADQPPVGASASKSEGPGWKVVSSTLSIKDAENAGFVRTSFRNPEGSSSGDSVLLIVVKIGGPDRLVLTIPPGLLLKSPSPASQDMIIAGLKGRDLGGGKYTPASTITLADNQPTRYVIEAYCAQFHKDNPPADKFDFGVGAPVEPGVVCVLNEARHQQLSVAGTQAAIWIHVEHVTFSEMNTRMSIGSTEWSKAEAVVLRCASK